MCDNYNNLSVKVNDIFDDLANENTRLLNELIFANKCLNRLKELLNKFKDFNDFVFNAHKKDFNQNILNGFQELNKEAEHVFNQTNFKTCLNIAADRKPGLNLTDNYVNKSVEALEPTSGPEVKSNLLPKPIKPIYKTLKSVVNGFQLGTKNRFKPKKRLPLNHRSVEPLKCTDCEKTFNSEHTLNRHNRLVHKKTLFIHICDYIGCDFGTNKSHLMVKHKNIVHKNVRPFECCECDSKFGSQVSLNIHKKSHLLSPVKCQYPGCNKTFKRIQNSKSHYKKIHLNIRPEKTIHCEEPGCQFSCDTQQGLKSHKYSHTNERPSVCTVDGCGKAFKNKSHLRIHMRSHIIDFKQPFKCTECDFTYTHPGSLRPHRLRAHSKKVIHCEWPGCEYTTKITACMTRHQLVHKVAQDFVCEWPECHKTFKSNVYLKNHLKIHNNDKRYACQWPGCEYRCVASGNLIKHRKVHQK